MANERRLIDANALLVEVVKAQALEPNTAVAKIIMLVTEAESVDAVEVPCKIGDTVWCIQNNFGRPIAKQGVVSEIYFGEDMRLGFRVKGLCGGAWGERVFATREEAEAAVEERRTDNA